MSPLPFPLPTFLNVRSPTVLDRAPIHFWERYDSRVPPVLVAIDCGSTMDRDKLTCKLFINRLVYHTATNRPAQATAEFISRF